VKVYNDAIFDHMVHDSLPQSQMNSLAQSSYATDRVSTAKSSFSKSSSKITTVPIKVAQEKRAKKFEKFWKEQKDINRENERKKRDKIIKDKMKKEQKFNEMYHTLKQGRQLADEMEKMLNINDMNVDRKKTQQYQSWNDNVYNTIQDGIKSHLDSTDRKALNQRKREEYQQFLDAMNQKGAIFRDIIIESDYDPLVSNKNSITYKTQRIEDPTKRVLQKGEEEAKMIHPGRSLGKQAMCRDTFDTTQWATGKVEASPHGHFTKMFRSDGPALKGNPTQKSRVVFDQFNFPKGKEAVDCELPKGKKMDF